MRAITLTVAERNVKIVELRHAGLAVRTIASQFGLTTKHVYEVLRNARAIETSQTQRWIEGMKA